MPGTNRACPWDKPTSSQGQTQVFSLFTQGKPSLSRGRKAADKVYVLKSMCLFRSLSEENSFLLTVGTFLLTVELLCLQSVGVRIRRKHIYSKHNCKQRSSIASRKLPKKLHAKVDQRTCLYLCSGLPFTVVPTRLGPKVPQRVLRGGVFGVAPENAPRSASF